jgi:hypothetical protein
MILALDDAEPHDGFVHFAQRLVVPLIRAGIDEARDVDDLERLFQNVEPRVVRKSAG